MNLGNVNEKGQFTYYLKKFIGFKGFFGLIAGVYPILGNFLGFESKMLMPPLNNSFLVSYIILIILIIFVAYLHRYIRVFRSNKLVSTALGIILLVLAFFSFINYVIWHHKVVRCGQVQPENRNPVTYCVIIGLERSEFANQNFIGFTDEKMLRYRGWTPEQVRLLWTEKSIEKAMLRVIGYFLLIPLLLVAKNLVSNLE